MSGSSIFVRSRTVLAAAALAVAGLSCVPAPASAATNQVYFVSLSGNDANPGTTAGAPLRTLQAAQVKVRQALATNVAPGVQVAGGTYELSSALTFGSADSGGSGHPYEGLQLGDWAVARTGAFYTRNTQNITVTRSSFDQLGGNGVFMDGYNDGNVVSGSSFVDDGATDVQTVGSRAAVRDPSTWSHQITTLDDTASGPKTQDYPRNITVSGNQMSHNGRFEKQSAGVNISMSQNVRVLGNTVHGSPRSCVNINDGTWGGDLIQDNDIFDCVKETSDHGPINMWGRDRFWPLSGGDSVQKQYALLDVVSPIVVNHNRIWHNSQWDLDLDDGSSNYRMTNNLLLNAGIKLRDGFYRTVTNNILVNGTLYEQVSHPDDGDVVEHNITLTALPYSLTLSDPAGARYLADYNLFWNNGNPVSGLDGSWSGDGEDLHSRTADPQFTHGNPWTDPTMLDYTLGATSPALGLGFANFPMNTFGVPGAPTPPALTWPNTAPAGEAHAVGAGKCLDVPGWSTTAGTQLQIWDCNGGGNQIFAHNSSGGPLRVYSGSTQLCLDAEGGSNLPGTKVITWACNSQTNQQWNLNSDGTITGAQSGLCLDVRGGSTVNGAPVELWTCNGGSNQQWKFS